MRSVPLCGTLRSGTGVLRPPHAERPFGEAVAPKGFSYTGAEPMASVGDVWVAFAGRLDDVGRLRETLRAPASVDAEALLVSAYRRWGTDFCAQLVGEFAIVIWDERERRLVLARDASGSQSLYYSRHGDEFLFASEVSWLVDQRGTRAEADPVAVAHWLLQDETRTEATQVKGIRRVPAGSVAVLQDGRVRVERWWKPESIPTLRLRDSREYAEGLLCVLRRAVEDRLPGEGVVASQLSGGLDSAGVSTLAAAALARRGRPLWCVTAVPRSGFAQPMPDRFYDEGPMAASVAAMHANVHHERVTVEGQSLVDVLDRYSDAEGRAVYNPDHLMWVDRTYRWAAAAGANTMLVGSMGNMTASYNGDFAMASLLAQGRWITCARLACAYRRNSQWTTKRIAATALQGALQNVFNATDRWRGRSLPAGDITGVREEFAQEMQLDDGATLQRFPFRDSGELRRSFLRRTDMGTLHYATWLQYGLRRTDPMFDQRVVEYSLSVPDEHFASHGVPRSLMRDAMRGLLPENVRLERRRGLQSSDFLLMLAKERAAVAAELRAAEGVPLAREALDLNIATERLEWSDAKVIEFGWGRFACRLMRTLSMARFLRRMEEGTVFNTLAQR